MNPNVTWHIGNPIVHHGIVPAGHTAIAHSVVVDGDVTADGFRVWCHLLSHDDGNEESKQRVADVYGWGSGGTLKAFRNLVAQRLLIIQLHLTAKGTRAYETYHVQLSGERFTDAEVSEFGMTA